MEILKFLRLQWDRAGAVGVILAGVLALYLGYRGTSGTPFVAAQLPYFISGGLVGLFALGVGCLLWLSADLRDEWREMHAVRLLLEKDLEWSGIGAADDDVRPKLVATGDPESAVNGHTPQRRRRAARAAEEA